MITEKIWIPLLKAIITGVLFALFGAAFFVGSIPWRVFWLVLAGVCLISWLAVIVPKSVLRNTDSKSFLRRKDSKVYPLKVSIDWNDGHAGLFSEMGIERDQFIAWCIGAAGGRSLGENHWTGLRGPFSKGEYHQFRDELIQRGLIAQRGKYHSSGFQLTGKGRAVCAEVVRRFGGNGNYSPTQEPGILNADRPLAYLRESARAPRR